MSINPSKVQLINRGWRSNLAEVAEAAEESLIVAAPYIKDSEAAWLCSLLHSEVSVLTFTKLDPEAISTSALDVTALQRLAVASPASKLIALPKLHAKLFVADEKVAIITSGNLTHSGLDSNIEYGVVLRDPVLVRTVRRDMLNFARLGSAVAPNVITDLLSIEIALRQARANVIQSTSPEAKHQFDNLMSEVEPALLAIHVGDRSLNAIFSEAVRVVLGDGPQMTSTIYEGVQQLLPDLCDDTEGHFIKGVYYGKKWQHRVRTAQKTLRDRGIITLSNGIWALTIPPSREVQQL